MPEEGGTAEVDAGPPSSTSNDGGRQDASEAFDASADGDAGCTTACDGSIPEAHAGGPYSVGLGGAVRFDASASTPATPGSAALVHYAWDLDDDGVFGDVDGVTPEAIDETALREAWGMTGGENPIAVRVTDEAGQEAVASATVSLVMAATLTGTLDGSSSRDTWNNPDNWDTGSVPTGSVGVVVAPGVEAEVDSEATPSFSEGLLLREGSSLQIGWTTLFPENIHALGTGRIVMEQGSQIIARAGLGNYDFQQRIVLRGDATIWAGISTANHHTSKSFSGGIRGAGRLTYNGVNRTWFRFNRANPGWTGGLQTADPQGQPHAVEAQADGCFGTGDVAINGNASLEIAAGLSDAIDDGAVLSLSGAASSLVEAKLVLHSDETIHSLLIDGTPMAAGTYTNAETWLSGSASLTVLSGP